MVLAVLLLTFALLTLAFRSLLVPLKAVTLSALSVLASHGVLVTVFQYGWGARLLDATLVRIVLVPAFMRLAGRWNWWLPPALDRVLPTVELESREQTAPNADGPEPGP